MDPSRRPAILVVEDDADTRANLRDILEMDDYRVAESATAAEALARDDWDDYTAVILDRILPDGTALGLLPRLRRLAPEADVIVVTGYAQVEGAIDALRLGASDYILKPLNADALRASIGRIEERRRLRREMELAQQRALQAERLAAIGQMVAGLAHESRNALQRSQACLERLAWAVHDRPDALDLIGRIQRAQDDLTRLYEDVRLYAAPIHLEPKACDLGSVWREAWDHLEPAWRGRDAALHERADGDPEIIADPFRLGQAFRNFFDNALAACPDPVVVEVRTEPARLEDRPALRVAVCDNGPGFGPADRARLFEPFFTTKTKGTGLGLAIARRIVEAHGGRIGLGEGPGAEIVLTLPRRPP
jgi:signal transduction histidine kinase